MAARFCVNAERGITSSQPAARACAANSVCTCDRKPTTRTPFFAARSRSIAAIGWLREFRSTISSLGGESSKGSSASAVVATFTSTPSCFAVSASFIRKNRSSISATTLPMGLRLLIHQLHYAPVPLPVLGCCATMPLTGSACSGRPGNESGCAIVLLERRPFHSKRCFAASFRTQIMNGSPEDERLAASEPRAITLYTRPGCHLCEDAKALIEPMLGEFGATLREVNIDEDAVLRRRYGTDIPVIFIGSRKAAKHRVDPVKFRRQLRNAV